MPMELATLLRAIYPGFDGSSTKLHLAQKNNFEHPLDVFYGGSFKLWQDEQSKQNFGRKFVLSLIETRRRDLWLFAGLWQTQEIVAYAEEKWFRNHGYRPKGYAPKKCWLYDLMPVNEVEPLSGRLHIRHNKGSRSVYRNFETVSDQLIVSSLMEQPVLFPRFTGFRHVHLSMDHVRAMYHHTPEDWQTALGSVGGVYLLTDPDGRQYVGSASGVLNLWGRWADYAKTGHGNNKHLIKILGSDPIGASKGYFLSILETADSATTKGELIQRESHWKTVLGSQAIGLNLN